MKINRLTLLMLVAICNLPIKAQYSDLYVFEQGNHLAGASVGMKFANDNRTAFSAFYENGLTRLFVDECTLGGGLFGGYYKNKLGKEIERKYIFGGLVNVHYQFVDRLDTYAGIDPNFNIRTFEIEKDKARFDCYFHVGGRYYLTNWLGIFVEASTGYNTFSFGVNVKL